MSIHEALGSREQLGKFMFGCIVLAVTLTILLLIEKYNEAMIAGQKKIHDAVIATTDDVSRGSGLVRIRQVMLKTSDGACTITVQTYTRGRADGLFLGRPRIETFQCTGVTM